MDKRKRDKEKNFKGIFADYTEEDQEFNSMGRISPWQRKILKRERRERIFLLVLSAVILIILGISVIDLRAEEVMGAGTVVVLFWFVAIASLRGHQEDLRAGRAAVVQGMLAVYRAGNSCFIRIEDQEFAVSQRQFMKFRHGKAYRLYYAPNTRKLLAVIELDE